MTYKQTHSVFFDKLNKWRPQKSEIQADHFKIYLEIKTKLVHLSY